MWFWIIGAVVVVTLATWAFWPSHRGGIDGRVRRQKSMVRAEESTYQHTHRLRWPSGE